MPGNRLAQRWAGWREAPEGSATAPLVTLRRGRCPHRPAPPHFWQGTRALPYKRFYNFIVGRGPCAPPPINSRTPENPLPPLPKGRGTNRRLVEGFRAGYMVIPLFCVRAWKNPPVRRARRPCPAARTSTAPHAKPHVIAKPVRTLAVAIRNPRPLKKAPLRKGSWHGEAVTEGSAPAPLAPSPPPQKKSAAFPAALFPIPIYYINYSSGSSALSNSASTSALGFLLSREATIAATMLAANAGMIS